MRNVNCYRHTYSTCACHENPSNNDNNDYNYCTSVCRNYFLRVIILRLSLLVPFERISVRNKTNCVNGILLRLIRLVKRFYQFSILSTSNN